MLQLAALYWPRAVGPPSGLPLDKVAHVLIFAAVMWTGLRAGLPAVPLAGVLLLHAVASELIQARLFTGRSGDVWDGVADAAGVLLAWALAHRIPDRPGGLGK